MDQLGNAMGSIKQASSQAASSTRQTEESVRSLAEMARQMEEAAARYRLDDTHHSDVDDESTNEDDE